MSVADTATVLTPPRDDRNAIDRQVVAFAIAAIVLLTVVTARAIDFRQSLLVLLGAGFGIALFHASFGFTGGWRALVTEGRSAGLRAQMLTIGLATLVILPLVSAGEAFGLILTPALGPIGVSLVAGSFLFGLGMQLGGGCGSGTLYTVGGGNVRMLVTLLFFAIGALIGTAHLPWWADLPNVGVIRIDGLIGVWPAVAVVLAGLAAVAALGAFAEKRRRGHVEPLAGVPGNEPVATRLLRGKWPPLWGAIALALLSIATLFAAGHPWSITFAFNLWAAKAATALGVDVASWTFWTWPMPSEALASSVLAETTSVTNFGIVLGALLAAGLAGTFKPDARIPLRSLLAAILGGLAMGYGARLAFGCNIGALFSGIASGSLHGWAWFAVAFVGSLVGIRLRPWFGLSR